MRTKKWCNQCRSYGHRKWLWLGTHPTHRLYIRYLVWNTHRRAFKRAKKEARNGKSS